VIRKRRHGLQVQVFASTPGHGGYSTGRHRPSVLAARPRGVCPVSRSPTGRYHRGVDHVLMTAAPRPRPIRASLGLRPLCGSMTPWRMTPRRSNSAGPNSARSPATRWRARGRPRGRCGVPPPPGKRYPGQAHPRIGRSCRTSVRTLRRRRSHRRSRPHRAVADPCASGRGGRPEALPGRPAWRWAGRRTDPSVRRVAPVIPDGVRTAATAHRPVTGSPACPSGHSPPPRWVADRPAVPVTGCAGRPAAAPGSGGGAGGCGLGRRGGPTPPARTRRRGR
jgi:hypothetical protein